MSDLLNALLGQSATSAPDWLSRINQQAVSEARSANWPSKKMEHWRHTPVSRVESVLQKALANQGEKVISASAEIDGLDAYEFVFDGNSYQGDSRITEGFELVSFRNADSTQQGVIEQHLGRVFSKAENRADHVFGSCNQSLIGDGLLIRVHKNSKIDKPVLIRAESQQSLSHSRLLVVLETGASARVIENFADCEHSLVNEGITELVVGDNAELGYFRLSMEEAESGHIAGIHAELQAHARLSGFLLNLGSELKRTDLVVHQGASGSHCDLAGIYLPHDTDHVDIRSCVEHRVPHCTSDAVFRGILDDKSKAVFNGRIQIHKQAQKTEANLSNKNLLLKQGAEVYTKPELEIYADDVRCSHGATVSQIADKELYYLQTRGISRKEAEIMLSYGFINELLNAIPLEALQNYLRPRLAGRFTKDRSLLKHIG